MGKRTIKKYCLKLELLTVAQHKKVMNSILLLHENVVITLHF